MSLHLSSDQPVNASYTIVSRALSADNSPVKTLNATLKYSIRCLLKRPVNISDLQQDSHYICYYFCILYLPNRYWNIVCHKYKHWYNINLYIYIINLEISLQNKNGIRSIQYEQLVLIYCYFSLSTSKFGVSLFSLVLVKSN